MEQKLKLFNTLSKKKERFKPIKRGRVGMYACGPTVYDFAHLGNLRAYIFEDILKRVLLYNGYEVNHVMNITDVGHLTGDRDLGEDKLEKGARREGKTAWEIADFYTEAFKKDIVKLNIMEPSVWCKATDHIAEQVDLIKKLEEKGYTYKTGDGIYFDTSKVKDYNKLSHLRLAELKEGARVEKNPEKKNPTDFAVWKFSPSASSGQARRQMEWPSPWGVGFPGWHIECSAMSIKYLGERFDIHCGGIDHINIHHTNEIAQSEAATGKKPWVRYWLHNAFLNIAGGKKMAKSDGNFLTLKSAIIEKKLSPLAYRLAALQTHYRKPMEYSADSMKAAQNALTHFYSKVRELGVGPGKINKKFKAKFLAAVNDDLNIPKALAVVQELFKSKLKTGEKLATILDFDRVLGLDLDRVKRVEEMPAEIKKLVNDRDRARKEKLWSESDRLRHVLESRGYEVQDTKDGTEIRKL